MSEKFVILADVACDLSAEIREYIGMEDYLSGHFQLSDGREFMSHLEWDHMSCDEFYKFLGDRKNNITTAPLSPEEMYAHFERYAKDGVDILSMSISSRISATFSNAQKAAEKLRANYPNCRICCVDTMKMSASFGLLVLYAHLMKKEGQSMDAIVSWLETNKHKVHQMGPIDDLIFVARRGRISMGKAIMGSFAGVKPMGDCSRDGYVSVLAKVKGIHKALEITAEYVAQMAMNVEDQYLIICHSNRSAYAQELKTLLEQKVSCKKIFLTDVFPGCGSSVGPGMVGVYFLGAEISTDSSIEKNCLTKIIENF